MYSFGSSGGLRARRFSLKSTLSHAILQGASFIAYAQPALQATLFAYRTLFRFRYADPVYVDGNSNLANSLAILTTIAYTPS